MRALLPTHSIMGLYPEPERCLEWFERIGRICYKSEERITETSAPAFVRSILKLDRMEKLRKQFETLVTDYIHLSKDEKVEKLLERVSSMLDDPPHESVIEHSMMTVHFRFDRGVSHEEVRHRIASFTQESSRYCDYSRGKFGGEIATIEPSFWAPKDGEDATLWKEEYLVWKSAMNFAEKAYNDLIKLGAKPQEARSVLPNSLKTEIVVSANFREWRHIFRLRTSTRAHPQMREVMVPLLQEVQATPNLGLLFEDIHVTEAP